MRINNCHVARAVGFFKERFLKKWNLSDKISNDEPLVLFGCYDNEDMIHVMNNKTMVLIVWAGSDSMRDMNLYRLRNKTNVIHIAGSKWISKDLEAMRLKYHYIPVSVIDNRKLNLKPLPLGDKIYIYTHPTNQKFYGSEWWPLLYDEFGRETFVVANHQTFTQAQLMEVYKQTFVGLRLVNHDGLSETVIELGLLGRNVIYNGNEPNALNYETLKDVIELIKIEQAKVGKVNLHAHLETKSLIDVSDNWLNTENYEKI